MAAGKSERMGRNKLLLEIGGQTVLDRVLAALEASQVEEIIVVLGHRPDDLYPVTGSHGVETVFNPGYEEGMTSSLKAGLRKVSGGMVFLCLGDQPMLDPALLDGMIEALQANPEAWIVSPVHGGRRGHPVLFRKPLFPEILGLGPRDILRDVVRGKEDLHLEVQGGPWCTLDMDTPEDYVRIKTLIEGPCAAP